MFYLCSMPEMTTRRLNDAQLRDADLFIDNPLAVEGLLHDRPADAFAPVIIAEYHLSKESMVRCSYCEQRQHHQHGFVAEFGPGSRHLIGSECGQSKLDMHFQAARSSHKDLRSRQSYLRRLDSAADLAEAIKAECHAILQSNALREVEAIGKTLDQTAGDLMIRLRANDGSFYEDIQVRDLAAETDEDQKRGRRRFKNERQLIGQLRGRGILKADGLRLRIKALKDALRAAAAIHQGDTDSLTTANLKKAVRALDDAHAEANAAVGEIVRARDFFAPENIDLLVRWAASSSSVAVEADGSTLIVNGKEVAPPRSDPPQLISAIKQ